MSEMRVHESVQCFNRECGRVMGRLVEVDGVSFLQMGDLLLREAHGVCIHCGQPFHWSVRDLMFERLVGRVLGGRNLAAKT